MVRVRGVRVRDNAVRSLSGATRIPLLCRNLPRVRSGGESEQREVRFRKKPVEIEAMQWTGKNLYEIIAFTDGPPDIRSDHAGMKWEDYRDLVARDGLKIFTLEGAMLANVGDYIIRGIMGEVYPCKPGIFAATYEPAE